MRLHVILGHLGVKELIRALKHGRASELTIQEVRRIRCDVCAENVQPELPRPAVPHQVLNFNERLGLVILSLPHWDGFTKSVKCLNIACHGTLFQMIIPLWPGTTALDPRQACREGWQRWALKIARPLPGSPGADLRRNGDHRGRVSLASWNQRGKWPSI